MAHFKKPYLEALQSAFNCNRCGYWPDTSETFKESQGLEAWRFDFNFHQCD